MKVFITRTPTHAHTPTRAHMRAPTHSDPPVKSWLSRYISKYPVFEIRIVAGLFVTRLVADDVIAFSTGCTECALTELVSCRSHDVSAQQIQWFTLIVSTDRCRDLLRFFVNPTLPPSSAVLRYLTNVDVSDTPYSSTVVSHDSPFQGKILGTECQIHAPELPVEHA